MRFQPTLIVALFALILPLSMNAQMPKTWEAPLPSGPKNDSDYKPGPDSQRQPGVPEGKVFSFNLTSEKIHPGSVRKITVYVPAQYTGDKPACVYVGLDGLSYQAPVVFDNLIHKGEIPVLIGIGLAPGSVPSSATDGGKDPNPRYNRSSEFDALNDNLCRLLIEEVFPAVEKHTSSNGAPLRLSRDPNDRCSGGGSTGGIGAFTLAWERPDQFRRVFSSIGTYVGMRGGDRYPVLVRKTEPKPIRVFMQDGSNDQWLGGPEVGDWWIGNVALQRALEFSGYDVRHVWGSGSHNGAHATAIFPDAMRWLWRDWPAPIQAAPNKNLNAFRSQIIKPGEDWARVDTTARAPRDLAVDPQGNVYFRDAATRTIMRLARDGTEHSVIAQPGAGGALAFGADGKLHAADASARTIFRVDFSDKKMRWKIVARDVAATRMVVRRNGDIYYSDAVSGTIGLFRSGGIVPVIVARDLKSPTGLAPTPDGLWFAAIESASHIGKSYKIQGETENAGALSYPQNLYWFHVPDTDDDLGSGACVFDRDGRLYVATRLGIAALDRNGRTRLIIPMPDAENVEATDVCFGGEAFDTLYAICGNNIYKRKLNIAGAPAWLVPITLPRWGQG